MFPAHVRVLTIEKLQQEKGMWVGKQSFCDNLDTKWHSTKSCCTRESFLFKYSFKHIV